MSLGWQDMLKVYVAGGKALFVKARDATGEAVASMQSLSSVPLAEMTPAQLDETSAKLLTASHAARLLATGLEEDRRAVLELRAGLTPDN